MAFKYALPMYGDCYHQTEDGKTVLCGNKKIQIWAVTDREPPDYKPCMRCEWKRQKRARRRVVE